VHFDIGAIRLAGKDPRRQTFAGHLSCFVFKLMPVPAITPIQATLWSTKTTMNTGRVSRKPNESTIIFRSSATPSSS